MPIVDIAALDDRELITLMASGNQGAAKPWYATLGRESAVRAEKIAAFRRILGSEMVSVPMAELFPKTDAEMRRLGGSGLHDTVKTWAARRLATLLEKQ